MKNAFGLPRRASGASGRLATRLSALAAGAGLVAAAAFAAQPAAAENEALHIGAYLSVTGPASFLGDPAERTLELYVEKLNEAGGIDGREIELTIYDDEGQASRARTLVSRLIDQDGVHVLIGGSTTGTTMASVPLAQRARVPMISLAGGDVITAPPKEFIYATPFTARMACERIFEDIAGRGMTGVGLISGTGGFGESMREECIDAAPGFGLEIAADERYGPTDTDMTPQLTNIANNESVEVIVNPGFGQGPVIVTRNYGRLGIEAPLYQSHGVASREFIEGAGAAAEGVRLPSPTVVVADRLDGHPQLQSDVLLDYKETYERETGHDVSTFGAYAYDALLILIDAVERAGGLDPDEIDAAIQSTSGLEGTAGMFNMSPDDHRGLDVAAFRMLEIRDGDWHIVD